MAAFQPSAINHFCQPTDDGVLAGFIMADDEVSEKAPADKSAEDQLAAALTFFAWKTKRFDAPGPTPGPLMGASG
jgi:hypothetical protein